MVNIQMTTGHLTDHLCVRSVVNHSHPTRVHFVVHMVTEKNMYVPETNLLAVSFIIIVRSKCH